MSVPLMSERDLEFLLYELFDSEALTKRERFRDHDKQTFTQVIDTAKTIAEKYFLPIRQTLDTHQPTFDGQQVNLNPALKPAIDAVNESGIGAANADYEFGGMQLPLIITNAAVSYLWAAGGNAMGYSLLTSANANLLEAYASQSLIDTWVKPMRSGRFFGTMAMTEPGCGSGLADLTSKAIQQDDGSYRIFGNKIFISGGDHSLSENIVHLVLARVKGAPKGVKGISLFVVPKFLLDDDGNIGKKNDVALAGLFHKMGGRAHTSTALNFGETNGAVGYLVGEENNGLKYMFHMMNEARIMVGTSGAVFAMAGYLYSLDYAKSRPQGRLPSCKDPLSPMVNIIEHADVRRMLLAQKVYAEGAMALVIYGAQLSDDEQTAPDERTREEAKILLNLLTPVIKTWPSEYGAKANDLAIQVLGGYGYINEHPVEMFYRDNRLNAIHEGTTGIQSLDLLARKVPMDSQQGYLMLIKKIESTIETVRVTEYLSELVSEAQLLESALAKLKETTDSLLLEMATQNIDCALSNSTIYLRLFGHVVVAWIWLQQGSVASHGLLKSPHQNDKNFYRGKLQALAYFYRFELPQVTVWSDLLLAKDKTCYQMREVWF